MDIDNKDFYPTPDDVIRKMCEKVKWDNVDNILEPSAGKGNIIKYIVKEYVNSYFNKTKRYFNIDAIEPDLDFQCILKNIKTGSRYDAITRNHNEIMTGFAGVDFLSFQSLKQYDLIIMNPPFSEGDKHLLKAIDIIERTGGQIVCLLNSETIKNPYSNIRKELIRKLHELNAEINDLGMAFLISERRTDIKVSMIYIDIPKQEYQTSIFDNINKSQKVYSDIFNDNKNELIISEPIEQLIEKYKIEVFAGIEIIKQYNYMEKYLYTGNGYKEGLMITITNPNEYIELVRKKYWLLIMEQPAFMSKMTEKMKYDFYNNIEDLKYIEFNHSNIYQFMINMVKSAEQSLINELLELFDEITKKHSWTEYSKNILHYNGWKTNKVYKVNKKFILPVGNSFSFNLYSSAAKKAAYIEQMFSYLDYKMFDCMDFKQIQELIESSIKQGKNRGIETKYLKFDVFQKGTIHITVKDEKILKRFNLLCAQEKNWLPPSYAKKTYKNLSAEEKEVIDSYEGEKSYTEVVNNPKEYLFQPQLALT